MKEKRRTSRQEKGITLIALVVTIVIMLILAGVTLNGALGENGLFKKAKGAATTYEREALLEEMRLAILDKQLETGGELTNDDLEKVLEQYGDVKRDENGKVTGVQPEGKDEITLEEIENGETSIGGGASSGTSGGASSEDVESLLAEVNDLKSEVEELKKADESASSERADIKNMIPKIHRVDKSYSYQGNGEEWVKVCDFKMPQNSCYCFEILGIAGDARCDGIKVSTSSKREWLVNTGGTDRLWRSVSLVGTELDYETIEIYAKEPGSNKGGVYIHGFYIEESNLKFDE